MTTKRRGSIVAVGTLLAIAGTHVFRSPEAKGIDGGGPATLVAQNAAAPGPVPPPREAVESPPATAPIPEPVPLPGDTPVVGGSNARSIDFTTALRIAGSQNPQVGFANQRIAEAYAQLRIARILWLPAIRAGISYNRHEGPLQTTDGSITRVERTALQPGLGMGAVGAGSPAVPGVAIGVRLTDAVCQPRIFGHVVAARESAARATVHDLLLSTGLAYLDLLRAYQQQAIAQDTLENAQQLADLTASFARAGQGAQADADRARVELVLRQNDLERANEATQVASTRLVELLSLDPTQLLVPAEPTIAAVELVSRDKSVQELVSLALRNRPELAESQQLVGEAIGRMKREQYAPLLPSMLLGVSYSDFGGGPDARIDNMSGRFDLDAVMFWEMRGLGLGEAAARSEARARVCQAEMRKVQVMDRVAREVAEGYAQIRARQKQIVVAQSGIQAATDSFRRNYQRIREGQGLPIEALQAIQALDQARREYLRSVADYDESQFRLYRAIGCTLSDGYAAF